MGSLKEEMEDTRATFTFFFFASVLMMFAFPFMLVRSLIIFDPRKVPDYITAIKEYGVRNSLYACGEVLSKVGFFIFGLFLWGFGAFLRNYSVFLQCRHRADPDHLEFTQIFIRQ